MEQKLIELLEKHDIVFDGKKIMVAVSGGPDSVALLHIFSKWRKSLDFTLLATTFDHQLRTEAKEDVAFVTKLCKEWNIPLETDTLDVRHFEEKYKVSTQVAARTLRYEKFKKVMLKHDIDYLVLGHHGDDQIETMVMSFMRTTNLSGITGIPFRRTFSTGEIIRPLLAVSKAEIEYYLERNQLSYRIDPSNEDISYTRNYVRQLIVPKLKEKNHNLHVTIQQLAETLQEDEQYLQREAKRLFEQLVQYSKNEKSATIHIAELMTYPVPLQRRIYRLTLDYLYETKIPQLSYSHEQIFLSLLKQNTENKVLHFPNDLIVETSYGKILFYFKKETNLPFAISVPHIPATIPLPDGSVMEISYTKERESKREHEYICPASQLEFPLQIRTRKPGDRMRYKGLQGSKKIKDIFIDEKIPRKQRDETYIVADRKDQILWLVGIRKGIINEPTQQVDEYILFQYLKAKEGDVDA